MPNRFTTTEKWQDSWFRRLSYEEKVLFLYMLDNCDIAGFIEIDFDLWSFYTGIPLDKPGVFEQVKPMVTLDKAFEGLSKAYVRDEKYAWIKNFIFYQGNLPLDPNWNPHKGILSRIKSHNSLGDKALEYIDNQIILKNLKKPSEGLVNPSSKGKGNSNINIKYSKIENLFFGDVPIDLMELAGTLMPTETASEWQDYVENEIRNIGYDTKREVYCKIDEDRNGRLDLVASKNGIEIAIELDYRTPREKSIKKVKQYKCGMVLLRDPKIKKIETVQPKPTVHPCLIDKKPATDFQTDMKCKPWRLIFLCPECKAAAERMKIKRWSNYTENKLEKLILEGKAKMNKRETAAEND